MKIGWECRFVVKFCLACESTCFVAMSMLKVVVG